MNVFDLVASIRLDTSEYEKGLNGASDKTSSFGDKLKSGLATAAKVGVAAVGAATTAVAGFAAASVKTGMTFDSSMSQVMATMGYSVDELNDKSSEASQTLDALRNFAMEMGSSTSFSASQAADALNYMALAGYDAETSMSMLPTVLNLAAAGSIDLASASDMITDAQSALGLTLDETVTMVDQMATASSKSNTSVAQLGEAILTVGGTAQNLAGGTTELNTALGILADNGIKGAEGGTHLRNVILSLTAPTDTAAGLLDSLGVAVFDADGNMRPLNETLGDLNGALSTMTQGEQINAINTIFNKTDIAAVNALLGGTGDRWDELSGYIDNASGSAQNMADVQLDNLAGDITLFQSALEGAQIVLSDQLTPTMRGFVQFGSDAISTLSTAFQEGGLSGAMDALGTILSDGLAMVVEQLPAMVDAGMQLLGALGQGLLDNLPTIADAAIEIVLMLADGLIEALPALAEGAVQIVTELANGIGAALPELLPKAVEAIMKFAEGLTNPASINKLLDAAVNIITGLVEGIGNSLPTLMEYAPRIIENLARGIINALPRLLEVGVQLIAGLGQGLIAGLAMIPEIIASVVSGIVKGFCDLFGIHSPSTVFAELGDNLIAGLLQGINNTWKAIVEFFGDVVGALIDFFSNAWETIKEGVSAAWDTITGIFQTAWEGIRAVWDTVVGFFSGVWEGIKEVFSAVTDVLGGFFFGAWEAVSAAWDVAVGFFSGVWDRIKTVFAVVSDVLGGFFSAAWDLISGIWDAVVGFFSGVWDGIKGVFSGVKDTLGSFFSDAWSAIKGIWNAATGFFSGIWDGISGAFSTTSEWFGNTFSKAWDAVTSAWDGVTDFFGGIWDDITGVFGNAWDKFKEIGRNIVDGIKNGISNAWSALTKWVTDKFNALVGGIKKLLGIHSPSTVFAGIGGNMALGLGEGWDDEYQSIKRNITNGLEFGTASVGLVANETYGALGLVQNGQQAGFGGAGNTYVTINSPVAVDAVQAAREWKKTTQRIAMGYV